MHSLKTVQRSKASFLKFLAQNGAEVLEPTNEWEVIRFVAGDVTSIIYKKATGVLTFTGESYVAFTAYKNNKAWRAMPRQKRDRKSSARLQAVRERDGDDCFYCLECVSVEDESEEHLVALTHGGPHHISNIFLAHKICNERVGHQSAKEKIRLHVEAHLEKAGVSILIDSTFSTLNIGDVLKAHQ